MHADSRIYVPSLSSKLPTYAAVIAYLDRPDVKAAWHVAPALQWSVCSNNRSFQYSRTMQVSEGRGGERGLGQLNLVCDRSLTANFAF